MQTIISNYYYNSLLLEEVEFDKYKLEKDFSRYVAEAWWEDWMLDYCVDAKTEYDEPSERDIEKIDEELLERFLKEKGKDYIEEEWENE